MLAAGLVASGFQFIDVEKVFRSGDHACSKSTPGSLEMTSTFTGASHRDIPLSRVKTSGFNCHAHVAVVDDGPAADDQEVDAKFVERGDDPVEVVWGRRIRRAGAHLRSERVDDARDHSHPRKLLPME